MRSSITFRSAGLILLLLGIPHLLDAQPDTLDASRDDALRIYIDCDACWESHIRSEMTFVNYVRDPVDAQVHLLVATQNTGSGGTEYTLSLIGRERFDATDDTLRFTTPQDATEEEKRSRLIRHMMIGLMRYVAHTPLADRIDVAYSEPAATEAGEISDPWDSWVFGVSVNAYLNGESSTGYLSLSSSCSAVRITPDWKFELRPSLSYSENHYDIDDTTTISAYSRSYSGSLKIVRSVTDHLSIGGFGSMSSGSYSNNAFTFSAAPAVEYNLYPYAEATRRQLTLLYKVGVVSARYREETIFGETEEILGNESLGIGLATVQTWGSLNASLTGSHYFHDPSKLRLSAEAWFDVRLLGGLSLNFYGYAAMIRDQLSLPKQGASPTQILLQQQQLATDYSYYSSIGLSYRFGSIYNNVVNTRFD
jgi:hypothetical protein